MHLINNFYNLVPVCSTCNRLKKDSKEKFFNPLMDHELEDYSFAFNNDELLKYHTNYEEGDILAFNHTNCLQEYRNWFEEVKLEPRIAATNKILKNRLKDYKKITSQDEVLDMPGDLNIIKYNPEDYLLVSYSKIGDDLIEQYKKLNVK